MGEDVPTPDAPDGSRLQERAAEVAAKFMDKRRKGEGPYRGRIHVGPGRPPLETYEERLPYRE